MQYKVDVLYAISTSEWLRILTEILKNQSQNKLDTLTIALTCSNFCQPPLLADWTHLFRDMHKSWGSARQQKVINLVMRFQVDLGACAEEVDALNIQRKLACGRTFVAFNPRILETSVSI